MERRGDLCPVPAGGQVVVDERDELRAAAECPGVRPRLDLACEQLELDRRLPFVVDLAADAEQGRYRVEQPAHPGRERRVHLQALAHDVPALERDGPPAQLQVDRGAPPRLADGGLSAGQRDRVEVRDPLEGAEIAAENLPAPERPVRSVARAVEDEREGRALQAVLGQTGGSMRVVVLNADQLGVLLQRPLRGQVLRVEVVGDHLRLDPEHGEVQLHVGEEGPVGELGVEVPEVRRQEGLASARDAERGLELGPGGKDRPRRRHGEGHRARHEATRPPQRERGADDGVLAAAVDRAVVGEEGVGDARQPLLGLGVLVRDRLVGAVSARQHERPSEVRGKEVVERRVGKHHAEPRHPGCDRLGHRCIRPAPDQDDWPLA